MRFFFSQLEEFLRVLHCVEVFLEIAALRLGGPAARWALIFSLQVGLGIFSLQVGLIIFSLQVGLTMFGLFSSHSWAVSEIN